MPTHFMPTPPSFLRRCLGTLITLLVFLAAPLHAQPSPDAATDSLIANSDMELDADADGWPDRWPKPSSGGSRESEDGNHFIRMTSLKPGGLVMIYREIHLPLNIKALELTWKQRVTNLKLGAKPWFDARILMEFMDAGRAKVLPSPALSYRRADSQGWEQKSLRFLISPGATTLKFMPCLFNVESGTYDLDDIVLKPIDPASIPPADEAPPPVKFAPSSASPAPAPHAQPVAAHTPGGPLLANGNLETAAAGRDWPDGWPGLNPENGSWENENGNRFIRLRSTVPDKMIMLYRTLPIPPGIPALTLTWRWRVTDLKVGKMGWYDARLVPQFLDAAGNKTADQPAPAYSRGTKGWEPKKIDLRVPEGAVTLVLMPALFQVTQGVMDIDDFVLAPSDSATIAALAAAARLRAEELAIRHVPREEPNKSRWPKELRVQGNRLVDPSGREVWLQGVNAGGLETLPSDVQPIKSTLVAIDDWKSNVIRLPVRDTYWLGLSPAQKDGGQAYRDLVDQCVNIAANRGAYVVLDLHRLRAPKAEHAEFWKSAAAHYKDHPAVLFDVFNEPHDTSWKVWRDGGWVGEKTGLDESAFLSEEEKRKNQGFESVGMQALVDAVRSTGAKNIVVAGGLGWAGDLSGVVNGYALQDKTGNGIMYSWHQYNWHVDWHKTVLPVAEKHPVLVGEFGADTNKMNFIPHDIQESPYTWMPDMLGFIQKHRLNWTAWCFHPKATPVLISDWKYTPTPFAGAFVKDALAGKKFEMKRMR